MRSLRTNGARAALLGVAAVLAACGPQSAAERPAPRPAPVPASAVAPAPLLPRPAPPVYRSTDKNVTFPTPAGAFYCPLPDDWIGSDHGTVVFLTRPDRCGGGGYPSSERGALDAPNIQIYYGYDVLEDGEKPPAAACDRIGSALFFGQARPLCIHRRGPIVEVRAEAGYMAEGAEADIEAEAAFTLVTSADRLRTDLQTFRTLLRETTTCNRKDLDRGPPYPNRRPDCAADAVWY